MKPNKLLCQIKKCYIIYLTIKINLTSKCYLWGKLSHNIVYKLGS